MAATTIPSNLPAGLKPKAVRRQTAREILQSSDSTLDRLVQDGAIKCARVGSIPYYNVADIERVLTEGVPKLTHVLKARGLRNSPARPVKARASASAKAAPPPRRRKRGDARPSPN
jgi:hypothetical protein